MTKNKKKYTSENKKHKIILSSDSHASGCAADVKHNLDKTSEIKGVVKPETKIQNITNTGTWKEPEELGKLTKKKVVVS
jgi:hypothetical protein